MAASGEVSGANAFRHGKMRSGESLEHIESVKGIEAFSGLNISYKTIPVAEAAGCTIDPLRGLGAWRARVLKWHVTPRTGRGASKMRSHAERRNEHPISTASIFFPTSN